MIKTEDKEFNKILKRAEEYRNNLKENQFEIFTVNSQSDSSLGEIFEDFFKNRNKVDLEDKNNIFLKYKISKSEALNGCEKEIKYKYLNEENKKDNKKIKIKFPKDIKDGQNIVIYQSGNYIKDLNKYSDVVITLNVKGE